MGNLLGVGGVVQTILVTEEEVLEKSGPNLPARGSIARARGISSMLMKYIRN